MADSARGLGNFTKEELQEFTENAYRRFYLRSLFIARQIIKAAGRKDFNPLRYDFKVIKGRLMERLNKYGAKPLSKKDQLCFSKAQFER